MKNLFSVTAIVAGVVLLGNAPSWAGEKATNTIGINLSVRAASGAVGPARSSSDSSQYIGCSASAFPGGSQVFCEARDLSGTSVMCVSSDPSLIATAAAISSISNVNFSWDENGNCLSVSVGQFSFFEPMVP